jgi:hypothetical protein
MAPLLTLPQLTTRPNHTPGRTPKITLTRAYVPPHHNVRKIHPSRTFDHLSWSCAWVSNDRLPDREMDGCPNRVTKPSASVSGSFGSRIIEGFLIGFGSFWGGFHRQIRIMVTVCGTFGSSSRHSKSRSLFRGAVIVIRRKSRGHLGVSSCCPAGQVVIEKVDSQKSDLLLPNAERMSHNKWIVYEWGVEFTKFGGTVDQEMIRRTALGSLGSKA